MDQIFEILTGYKKYNRSFRAETENGKRVITGGGIGVLRIPGVWLFTSKKLPRFREQTAEPFPRRKWEFGINIFNREVVVLYYGNAGNRNY